MSVEPRAVGNLLVVLGKVRVGLNLCRCGSVLVVMAGQEFDEFFRACFDPVARALMLAGAERELAHDATQEALVRALRRWRQVRELGRPDGWVYVVAMNYVRDRWRRQARGRGHDPDRAWGRASVDPSGAIATRLCVRDAITTINAESQSAQRP